LDGTGLETPPTKCILDRLDIAAFDGGQFHLKRAVVRIYVQSREIAPKQGHVDG
jgi:hypothetical protein